jgi:hypothetical protein
MAIKRRPEAKRSNFHPLFLTIVALLLMCLLIKEASAFCFGEAGEAYGVSPLLLQAIMVVESQGNPEAINYNKDGSYDFGLMQINSSWARPWGLEVWGALGDPCVNVYAGAYLLAECIRQFGQTWDAVGCYNARTREKKIDYVQKVKAAFERLKAGGVDEDGGERCRGRDPEDSQRSCSGLQ